MNRGVDDVGGSTEGVIASEIPAAVAEGVGRLSGRQRLAELDEDALRSILASEPVIEQAKGLVMGHYRIDADEAFDVLSRWSSRGHVKIRDLAERLVRAAPALDSQPEPFDPLNALAQD